MSDSSSKILMVDERQTVREVLDKLFEKTHCDCSFEWSLCETNPELQIGAMNTHRHTSQACKKTPKLLNKLNKKKSKDIHIHGNEVRAVHMSHENQENDAQSPSDWTFLHIDTNLIEPFYLNWTSKNSFLVHMHWHIRVLYSIQWFREVSNIETKNTWLYKNTDQMETPSGQQVWLMHTFFTSIFQKGELRTMSIWWSCCLRGLATPRTSCTLCSDLWSLLCSLTLRWVWTGSRANIWVCVVVTSLIVLFTLKLFYMWKKKGDVSGINEQAKQLLLKVSHCTHTTLY